MIDPAGAVKNEWHIDWFELWPDATHVPPDILPQTRPGTIIQGINMLSNGDVLFNLENLGLFRMTPCGETVWKLPYQTHHSIQVDNQENLWVSGLITRTERSKKLPGYGPNYLEPMILKISPDGEILQDWSVLDIFMANDLTGYLFLPSKGWGGTVTGDSLHLNDVEVFTEDMAEGFFEHGDVMVSLRNIGTVFVFEPDTLKIKYIETGVFTRQHDPDFIDGNTISVFDNNNIAPPKFGPQSRILVLSMTEKTVDTWYQGTPEKPFFTPVMGDHEWLAPDVALMVESSSGRVIAVDSTGKLLWEYFNETGPNTVGIIPSAMKVPDELHDMYRTPQAERCAR